MAEIRDNRPGKVYEFDAEDRPVETPSVENLFEENMILHEQLNQTLGILEDKLAPYLLPDPGSPDEAISDTYKDPARSSLFMSMTDCNRRVGETAKRIMELVDRVDR